MGDRGSKSVIERPLYYCKRATSRRYWI